MTYMYHQSIVIELAYCEQKTSDCSSHQPTKCWQ